MSTYQGVCKAGFHCISTCISTVVQTITWDQVMYWKESNWTRQSHIHLSYSGCNYFLQLHENSWYTVHGKIFTEGSYYVLGQKFHQIYFVNHASYLPGSCGWSSRVAMCICTCAHDRSNVSKIFTVQKNSLKTFLPTACIGKNFHVYGS